MSSCPHADIEVTSKSANKSSAPLTAQNKALAQQADVMRRTQRASHFRGLSSAHEAEYQLIYQLEVQWNAVKMVLSTWARLGFGRGVTEDELGYEDDLIWMGAKTEIGAAGEGVRKTLTTDEEEIGGSSSSKGGSTPSTDYGDATMQRLRNGAATDPEIRARIRTLVRLHDALVRGKKKKSNWITEETVLRRSVYAVVIQGFRAYPVWHEDREFVDRFLMSVDTFVDHDP